jgi:hypothetical protein
MAERPDGASAERAESALRQSLRESGLAWIVEQVDEGLTQMASDQDQPPSAETRLYSATWAQSGNCINIVFGDEQPASSEREFLAVARAAAAGL